MSADTIRVRVNGEDREIPSGLSVHALLESFDLKPEMIVVERNRETLTRDDYPTAAVAEGDVLELVHFVGGG